MGPTTDSQHVILASTETGVEASSPLQLQLQLQAPPPVESKSNPDIEHAPVEDDPRTWTNARKTTILLIISGASMLAGLSVSIQNPANAQIEQQLHATSGQLVYLLSLSLFTLGSAIVAVSKSIGLVIGMRVLQGIGSSAVLAIGAATLADMYEPHERGTIVGIYYCAPLLGPSLGPIIGGVLTQALSWRAIFWFLVICGGVILSAFLFLFKDTFRKERSSAYQNVLKKRAPKHQVCETKWTTSGEPSSDEGAIRQTREDIEASAPVVTAEIVKDVKLTFVDMNPFPPYGKVLDRKNNVAVLVSSGLLFAFCYSITYTCARTLATQYDFDALMTGLVLLSYGIGPYYARHEGICAN
ncbi:hypothetical protein ID866_2229 [Astraeus odoratus]|nr:hypothetical protein ID866_2229 [Astraeus odoratus]